MQSPTAAKFATIINCIDGRTQLPVIDFMKTRFNVEFVDVITEPGPVKAIAEPRNAFQVYSIQQRLTFSQQKHASMHLGVVAHHDCISNPVERDKQIEQLRQSLDYIRLWGFKGVVVGLWVNENWEVQEVYFNL
jgi:hypothetical protein